MNELLAWIPAPFLAGAAWLLGKNLVTKFTDDIAKNFETLGERFDKVEATQEKLTKSVADLSAQLGGYATHTALSNLGDRFDARHQQMREDIGALRERIARLEAKG